MLSNPDAPLHPSRPDERDRDGADTEMRKTERQKQEMERGEKKRRKRQKAFRERRRDDARQHVCSIFVHMCVSWVKCECVSVS